MLENGNNLYQELPQGCFWGDVEMYRQVRAGNNVYFNNADVVELQVVGMPWVQMGHPFSQMNYLYSVMKAIKIAYIIRKSTFGFLWLFVFKVPLNCLD